MNCWPARRWRCPAAGAVARPFNGLESQRRRRRRTATHTDGASYPALFRHLVREVGPMAVPRSRDRQMAARTWRWRLIDHR